VPVYEYKNYDTIITYVHDIFMNKNYVRGSNSSVYHRVHANFVLNFGEKKL